MQQHSPACSWWRKHECQYRVRTHLVDETSKCALSHVCPLQRTDLHTVRRFFRSTATFRADAFFETSPMAIAACARPDGHHPGGGRPSEIKGPLPVGHRPSSSTPGWGVRREAPARRSQRRKEFIPPFGWGRRSATSNTVCRRNILNDCSLSLPPLSLSPPSESFIVTSRCALTIRGANYDRRSRSFRIYDKQGL